MPMPDDNQKNMNDDQLLLFTKLFNEFDSASLSLKRQYGALQDKVEELLMELDEKNRYLEEIYKDQQETNNLLYTILSNLSSGVAVFNTKLQVVVFNKKAHHLTGVSPEEAIGRSYQEIFKYSQEEGNYINLLERQVRGDYVLEEEGELIGSNDEIIPIFTRTSVLTDENDELSGYIHVFDDLTKVKAMEEDVRKNKSLSEIGQMTAAIAHEIRNPLGGIGGFATMLARDLKDDSDKLELVDRIREGVSSLSRITTDVLAFSRPIKTRILNLSIKEIIISTNELLKSELVVNSLVFELKEDFPASDISIDIDMQLIQRSLLNLLRNAVQSVPEGKKVLISVKLRFNLLKNQCVIEVKDNGCGIDEEKIGKLFIPFFTTKAEGTGLGLAMVKRMIEAMGGTIHVSSIVDVGSVFKMIMPIRNEV